MSDITIKDNPAASRYELQLDGELAGYCEYLPADGFWVLPHTEVLPKFEGQGIAGQLVKGMLDDIRAAGRRIMPTCPYVIGWLGKHPDYQDLVID